MQEKFIATTSIHNPTKAYELFSQKKGWTLVIAGDKKTPDRKYREFAKNAKYKNVIYLSLSDQHKLFGKYSEIIGENVISRRIFAILYAYSKGADIIALVDDDNIPEKHWGKDLIVGQIKLLPIYLNKKSHIVDPLYVGADIKACTRDLFWHRGFPFEHLDTRYHTEKDLKRRAIRVDVQADMWEGELDIDAVCRLHANNIGARFVWNEDIFPFSIKGYAPFNSQNVFISRHVVKDYMLFPALKRMEDIWAAYYLEAMGYYAAFNKPSVYQDRNAHNFLQDFGDEFLGYQKTSQLLSGLTYAKERLPKFEIKEIFMKMIPSVSGVSPWMISQEHAKIIAKIDYKRNV